MKFRTFLFSLAGLFIASAMTGQRIVQIQPGEGTLEHGINEDVTVAGERTDPNTIYELEPGEVYIMNSGINFESVNGTLTIRMKADAPAGSKKPIIVRLKKDGVDVSDWAVDGSLTMENIHYQGIEISEGQVPAMLINIVGDNRHLVVDGCLFEFAGRLGIFNMNLVPEGAKLDIRNSYFRDLNNFYQWWQGRIVLCKVPIDEFLFENNTVTGGGLTVIGQASLWEYAVINHNTFINNHKYPFLNQYWKECYFTNNLFVNTNMVGEDAENIAIGGLDPDGRYPVDNGGAIETREMFHGITGIDTIIAQQIAIQPKFYNEDLTLTSDVDEISDYIFYCADNVVVSSATLDRYYAGETGNWTGTLSSYLNWSGVGTPPFEVKNVPGIWRNSRAEALDADWDNITWENNSVYEMKAEEIGFATEVLPQAAADVFAQWNQNMWGVPGAAIPTDFTAYQFGDWDPTTIPGVEVENASPGEAGITKISDMVEDFSYSANLISKSDGLKIGALHWDDIAYDSEASIAAVKSAYNRIPILQLPVDFETPGEAATWYHFANAEDDPDNFALVENPDKDGINISDNCILYRVLDEADPWVGAYSDAYGPIEITADNYHLGMMVFKDVISPVVLKLEKGTGENVEIKVPNTVTGEWELLDFDMSAAIGYTYDRIVFFPDFPDSRITGSTCYIDYIGDVACALANIRIESKLTAPVCEGGSDGEISLTVDGAYPPFAYLWSNGATTKDLDELAQGTYTVNVTDSNGCSETTVIQLIDPDPIIINLLAQGNICHADSSGSISIEVSGGTPPYMAFVNDIETQLTANNLSFGDYTIKVLDSKECIETEEFTLIDPAKISINEITGDNEVKEFLTYIYSVPDQENYIFHWAAQGGNVITGQGTNVVAVQWNSDGSGVVMVVAESEFGCYSDTVELDVSIYSTSGLADNARKVFNFYPNPTTGYIYLNDLSPADIRIYTIRGRLVLSKQNVSSVNLQNLNPGLYLVEVSSGKAIMVGAVIKE